MSAILAGYKQTEVGVIPEEWERVQLTTVARLESGHTPSRRIPKYWNGSIPWVSLHDTDALNDREIHSTQQSVTQEGIDNSSARILPKGTVVFSRTATVGKTTVLGRDMATSQDFANYISYDESVNWLDDALFVLGAFELAREILHLENLGMAEGEAWAMAEILKRIQRPSDDEELVRHRSGYEAALRKNDESIAEYMKSALSTQPPAAY